MASQEEIYHVLDVMCPMHVVLDGRARIRHIGPVVRKLRPGVDWIGKRFMALAALQRPRRVGSMGGMLGLAGMKLHLQLRSAPQTALKGVLVPYADGAIVNLSFGISVLEAVRDYALTSADFAATDLAIEMLYLVEAKSAAMEESRKLNLRLQGARIAAEEQAYTDTLTGLKNRRAMDHILERLIDGGHHFGLMHLDLDFFKAVNDSKGHAAGDYVLQRAARIMVEETRDDDVVARVGGDEFILIFPRLIDTVKLEDIAARLIARLEEPIPFNGTVCDISASIGITIAEKPAQTGRSAETLIEEADVALYACKRAGRGCFRVYTSMLGGMTAAQ